MNKINDAIKALTKGLKDGGCAYATNFSGFNSHLIFNELGGTQMSINERVAFEMAYGSSMAGKRSVVSFKSTGLNVASDVFLHGVLNGVNAGLIVILTEDMKGISSPEKQDSRPYRDLFGGLWLEPSSVFEAYEFGYKAFEWSEKFDMPVVMRLTNQFFNLTGGYEVKIPQKVSRPVESNRRKYISYWKFRDNKLKKKLKKISKFVETYYSSTVNQISCNKGIIVAGNCQTEFKKYDQGKYEVLRLSMYPLPLKLLRNFVKEKTEIVVLEQGNNYVTRQIRSLLSTKVKMIYNTGEILDRKKEWIVWKDLEKLFMALKNVKPSFVVGDEGSFTDESTKTIQVCLTMGASIGITAGMADSGLRYPFCVIGDTSFIFAGLQTLIEVKERNLGFGIIVIDNGGAKTTGGQKRMGDIYQIGDIPKDVLDYESTTEEQFVEILTKMKKENELLILFVKTK
jgi:indolepyruvate ferredoxin oxidoreductase alpha subunit